MLTKRQTSVERTVSTLCLDGYRLNVDLTVVFHRAVSHSDAESIGDEVALAVDSVFAEQISQGTVPFTRMELSSLTFDRTKHGSNKIADIQFGPVRVIHRTMPSTYREPPPPIGSTPKPPPRASVPAGGFRSSTPAPDRRIPSPLPQTQTIPPSHPRASPLPQTRSFTPGRPSERPTTSAPKTPAPVRPRSSSFHSIAPGSQRSAPPPSAQRNERRGPSLSAPPAPFWSQTLARSASSWDAVTDSFVGPLRESAAAALLQALSAMSPGAIDRLSWLEGTHRTNGPIGEVCACIGAAIYRAFTNVGVAHRTAAAVVTEIGRRALPPEGPPAQRIGEYIASGIEAGDLARQLTDFYSAPQGQRASVESALKTFLAAIEIELQETAVAVTRRLAP